MEMRNLSVILGNRLSKIGYIQLGKFLFSKAEGPQGVEHFINFEIEKERGAKLTCEFGIRSQASYNFGIKAITNFGDQDGLYKRFYQSYATPFNVRNSLLIYTDGYQAEALRLEGYTAVDIASKFLEKIENQLYPSLKRVETLVQLCDVIGNDNRLFPFSSSNTAFRLAEYIYIFKELNNKSPDVASESWQILVSNNLRNGVTYYEYLRNIMEYVK